MEHGGGAEVGARGGGVGMGALVLGLRWGQGFFVVFCLYNTSYNYTSAQIHGRGKSIISMQNRQKIRCKNMKQSLFRTLLKRMHGFKASALTSPTRFEPLRNAA